jgi:transcriptional regulator with XRE-family HTH domain
MMKLIDNKQVGERLKKIRQDMNISSARKFAMDADVDQSQYSKIERGELPLTDAIFDKLNKKYKIDKEHVLGIIVPHETNSKQKHITTRNNLKEVGESKRGIMVYESAPVQAGIRTVYHDEHAVPDYVLNIPQFRDCNYGTRASGDSMYPEVRNGDLIVCKELAIDARIIYGDMYVIHTKDGIETIKYVQQFVDSDKNDPWVLLVPHNKAAGMGTPIPRNEIIKLFKVRAIFKAY